MKKANCKSGCTSSCPCQCVRPKRRRARPNAAPRRNPIADLVTALLTQKLQEGMNKPPMFKPVEKKSIGTSTELEGGYRLGNAVAQKATPIETQTIETQTEKEKRIRIPKQEKEERKEEEEEEGFGAMRGEALQELRKKVKGMPKPKTIEDYFKTGQKPSSEVDTISEAERLRIQTAEESARASVGGGGGGAGPVVRTTEDLKKGLEKTKEKRKKNLGVMGNLVGALQQATDNAASAEGEQKVDFS